ncbi:unnamed protein product [Lymnaea stagnalis]|uniref:Uncharacterized protein n=1 Tax=Lymnaea stagnalis TaxID=6523 RepID=A0AAV2GWN7_LYMST
MTLKLSLETSSCAIFRSFSLVVALLISPVLPYATYQEQLPNGNNVPHPCKVNYMWRGLGHENPNGGGARNPFGLAFASAGHKWTRELCLMDTDGDGRSNGEELGDPSCVWTSGQLPSRTDGISHPGVCEPINSTLCKGRDSFVNCELQGFDNCTRVKQPGVLNITKQFPRFLVPAQETSYYCMTYDLPADQEYHIIAFEPVIVNRDVMHHILFYGCVSDSKVRYDQPVPCGMNAESVGCYDILAAWTVGTPGSCLPSTVGFRIGNSTYSRAMMQVHWNNPQNVQNYYDSSGIRIYYQPAVDTINDLTMFAVGQNVLEIPPGQTSYVQSGICPGSCTQMIFSEPVHVVMGLNHMHYLGRGGRVELYRNGSKVTDLTYDEVYSYDSPVSHIHDPPIQVLPGDEIRSTCVFNSMSSKRYIYFGESTQEEMCVMFLTVYPARAVRSTNNCVQVGPVTTCDRLAGRPVQGCDWMTFVNMKSPASAALLQKLRDSCSLDGMCRPECKLVHDEIAQHPCMKGDVVDLVNLVFTKSMLGLEFLGRFHSCSNVIKPSGTTTTPASTCTKETCGC